MDGIVTRRVAPDVVAWRGETLHGKNAAMLRLWREQGGQWQPSPETAQPLAPLTPNPIDPQQDAASSPVIVTTRSNVLHMEIS